MSKRKQFIAIASLLSIMLGMSLLGGSRGVLVPVLKQDFAITDSSIGMMFLISTLGYMIATFISGKIIYRLGNKKTLQLGTIIIVLSMALMFWSPSFAIFSLGFFINGMGNAFIILGVNLTTTLFTVAFQAALLNIIHGSYGLGAAIIQRITGYLISNNISWRLMFGAFIIYHISILVYISLTSYPQLIEKIVDVADTDDRQPVKKTSVYSNKLLYLYMAALGFGLMGEHGINNWFVNYMKEGFGISENSGSLYLSLFFVIFTIGRFFGGFLLERIGYIRGVIYAQLITTGLYLGGIFLGERGLYLMVIAGIFQAIIYPTLMITIPKVFTTNPAQAMAAIAIGTSIINNLSTYLLGILNDNVGVLKTFYMLPTWVFISALFAILIEHHVKANQKKEALAIGMGDR